MKHWWDSDFPVFLSAGLCVPASVQPFFKVTFCQLKKLLDGESVRMWNVGGNMEPGRVISPWTHTLSYDTRLIKNRFGRASVTAAADSVRMWRKERAWDGKLETLRRRGRRFVSSSVLCVLGRGHQKSTWLQLNRWWSSMPLKSELSHPSRTPGVCLVYLCGC